MQRCWEGVLSGHQCPFCIPPLRFPSFQQSVKHLERSMVPSLVCDVSRMWKLKVKKCLDLRGNSMGERQRKE